MVFERIQKIIAEKFDIDPERITKETSFTEDLELDSLDVAELVMDIETEFDIVIPDEAYENIVTVGDASEQIEKALG